MSIVRCLAAAALCVPALLAAARVATVLRVRNRSYDPADAPAMPVAVVFGAGLMPDGRASPVLHERVAAAAALYDRGAALRLLLSGSDRGPSHDEPAAMRQAALDLGVPDAALLLDGGGWRTWVSCVRARGRFGVTRAALVSQRYHLPRALLTCDALGIAAIGVAADHPCFPENLLAWWDAREVAATAVAWVNVAIRRLRMRRWAQ